MHQFDNADVDNAHAFAQVVAQFIKESVPQVNVPGAQIADIGCGTGLLTWYVQDLFWHTRLIGADPDEAVVQLAQASYPAILFTSVEQLEAQEAMFDLVYAAFVLHHIAVPKQREFLRIICNLIKPGGIGLIIELNPLHLPTALSFILNGEEKDARMIFPWTLAGICRELSVCETLFQLPYTVKMSGWFLRSFYAVSFFKK